MAEASRDANRIPVLIGASAVDGSTPIVVYVDPTTHELYCRLSSDIQIGAVEIKDGDSDTRVDVETDGTKNAMFTQTTTLSGINGAPVTIGTTAVELTFTGTTKSICVKAASTNTGLIWIGPSTVDDTGANAYGELTADSSLTIDFNDVTTALYAVSNIAAQKIYKVALT